MRAALLLATLLVVLAASALNLALGLGWVVAALAVRATRRRSRALPWLILLLALGAGAGAIRLGWLRPPAPTSYEAGEAGWLRARLMPAAGAAAAGVPTAAEAARARLAAVRAEELADTPAGLQRRAQATVTASRRAAGLRSRAPAAVSDLEEAARRIALTLTAPEFQDLERRRADLVAWLDAIDARLIAGQDPGEEAAVLRALDPAALARVSLRAVREDVTAGEEAVRALVRAVGGRAIRQAVHVRLEYDDVREELRVEEAHEIEAGGPLRIRRVDAGPPPPADAEGRVGRMVGYAADGNDVQPWSGGREIDVAEPGVTRMVVVDRRARQLPPQALATVFRRIPFRRLDLGGWREAGRAMMVTLGVEGTDAQLPVPLGGVAPVLAALDLPRHAFHYASQPGSHRTEDGRDVWRPAPPAGDVAALRVELVPPTRLLRNGLFARVKDYLYTPNPATALACAVLAALAVVLTARRPARTPARPPDPPPSRRS